MEEKNSDVQAKGSTLVAWKKICKAKEPRWFRGFEPWYPK
jgi:hypothetical protein